MTRFETVVNFRPNKDVGGGYGYSGDLEADLSVWPFRSGPGKWQTAARGDSRQIAGPAFSTPLPVAGARRAGGHAGRAASGVVVERYLRRVRWQPECNFEKIAVCARRSSGQSYLY